MSIAPTSDTLEKNFAEDSEQGVILRAIQDAKKW